MPRNRQSAKQAGARFERLLADHLAQVFDTRIDRRVKTGARDKEDITGLNVVFSNTERLTPAGKRYTLTEEQE